MREQGGAGVWGREGEGRYVCDKEGEGARCMLCLGFGVWGLGFEGLGFRV